MISDTVPSEHTPLSRRIHPTIASSSSGDSGSSNSSDTMDDTRRIIIKIVIDFLVVVCGKYILFFLVNRKY